MQKLLAYSFIFLYITLQNSFAQCYLPYIEHNRWGLLNDSLTEVLPPQYDWIKNYNDQFWIYKKGLKYGILNSKLQELTPSNYEVIYWIDSEKFLAYENKKYLLKYWKDSTFITFDIDTLYQAFRDWIHAERNNKQGILNYHQEWKIPPIYDELMTNGLDIIVLENQLYYYLDTTHQKKIANGFEEAHFFSEKLAAVKKDELYGFIDEKGNWITQKEFLNAQSFQENIAPVEKNNRWGYINRNNQLVIPYMYDFAYPFFKGKAIVQFKGKWGIISPTGKIVLPLEYDEIQYFEKNLFLIRIKHLWGIMNEKQEWLVKPEFVDFRKFHCGYWIFNNEYKTQVIINEKGEKVWKNF